MSETTREVAIAPNTDGGDRAPDLSPREAKERYLGRLKIDKREATVSTYDYQLKLFIEWCEENGIGKMSTLNGWRLEEFQIRRREQTKVKTLEKEAGTLQRFLEYCAKIELVDESLPEKVMIPDTDKQQDVNPTKLTQERAERLLAYYNAHDYGSRKHAILGLCWYAPARLNAFRGLDLEHYDSDDRIIEFHHEPDRGLPLKNGFDGERAVGVPDELADVLDHYIQNNRTEQYTDDGARPLLTTTQGRIGKNTFRGVSYLSTQPCLHTDCPHGHERETCDYITQSTGSQCPSSRAPHHIRTGSIIWHLNTGWPLDRLAERANTSVRTLRKHYDVPDSRSAFERRRRDHLDRLSFDNGGDDN